MSRALRDTLTLRNNYVPKFLTKSKPTRFEDPDTIVYYDNTVKNGPDYATTYLFACSVNVNTAFCCSTGQVGAMSIRKRNSPMDFRNVPFDPLNILDVEFLEIATEYLDNKTKLGGEGKQMPRWTLMLRNDTPYFKELDFIITSSGFIPTSSYIGRLGEKYDDTVICYEKSRGFQQIKRTS